MGVKTGEGDRCRSKNREGGQWEERKDREGLLCDASDFRFYSNSH